MEAIVEEANLGLLGYTPRSVLAYAIAQIVAADVANSSYTVREGSEGGADLVSHESFAVKECWLTKMLEAGRAWQAEGTLFKRISPLSLLSGSYLKRYTVFDVTKRKLTFEDIV